MIERLKSSPVAGIDLDRLLGPQAVRSEEYEAVWRWMQEQDKALPDQTNMSIQEQRAVRQSISARWNSNPPEVESVERINPPGWNGAYSPVCELHTPFDAQPGALLYLHGGGWVFGDLHSHVRLARNLAIATRRPTLVVDYRLAPEHVFPAALDDATSAWRWLVEASGKDPRLAGPLAVAGDSAGANLGLALMLREQEARRQAPNCGLFFYGVYAGATDSRSYLRFAAGHGLTRAGMQKYFNLYAGPPDADGRWRNRFVSPIDASDDALGALPPLHLSAAGLDPLLCDTLAFGEKVWRSGGACQVIVHEGVQHGFAQISERLAEARRAIDLAGDFFQRHVG